MRHRNPDTTLLVIAKQPLPGRVKTRLVPPCTPEQAAALAEAALADTLHTVLAAPARRRVLVLDGEPGPWLPPGFDITPQCGGGLDERLAGAFAAVHGPALLIGMDTPQLTPGLLAVDWEVADAWFGPAADGGFWALGLRVPDAALVRGVPDVNGEHRCQPASPGCMRPGCVSPVCRGFATSTPRQTPWPWRVWRRGAGLPRRYGNSPRFSTRPAAAHQAGGAVREQV